MKLLEQIYAKGESTPVKFTVSQLEKLWQEELAPLFLTGDVSYSDWEFFFKNNQAATAQDQLNFKIESWEVVLQPAKVQSMLTLFYLDYLWRKTLSGTLYAESPFRFELLRHLFEINQTRFSIHQGNSHFMFQVRSTVFQESFDPKAFYEKIPMSVHKWQMQVQSFREIYAKLREFFYTSSTFRQALSKQKVHLSLRSATARLEQRVEGEMTLLFRANDTTTSTVISLLTVIEALIDTINFPMEILSITKGSIRIVIQGDVKQQLEVFSKLRDSLTTFDFKDPVEIVFASIDQPAKVHSLEGMSHLANIISQINEYSEAAVADDLEKLNDPKVKAVVNEVRKQNPLVSASLLLNKVLMRWLEKQEIPNQ